MSTCGHKDCVNRRGCRNAYHREYMQRWRADHPARSYLTDRKSKTNQLLNRGGVHDSQG